LPDERSVMAAVGFDHEWHEWSRMISGLRHPASSVVDEEQ